MFINHKYIYYVFKNIYFQKILKHMNSFDNGDFLIITVQIFSHCKP